MSSPVVSTTNFASQPSSYWLALALTPGLGPTRIRKLVEHFGSAEQVFQASLTELEATGMPVVSAQSLATGNSLELAHQEMVKAAGYKVGRGCCSGVAHTSTDVFALRAIMVPNDLTKFQKYLEAR